MNHSLQLPIHPRTAFELIGSLLAAERGQWHRRTNRYAARWDPVLGVDAQLPASILLMPVQHGASQVSLIALDDHPLPASATRFLTTLQQASQRALAAKRAQVYRRVALDRATSPGQRLHAARVLGESDPEHAAQLLARLVHHSPNPLIKAEALAALAPLGLAARPALWWLDATVADGPTAMQVALVLAEVGDPETASYRLEQLARHQDPELRADALAHLSAMGSVAQARMASLAQRAEPTSRLYALRWLAQHGDTAATTIAALAELAADEEDATTRREAIGLLGQIGTDDARAALRHLLDDATESDSRLAIAEQLHRSGDTGSARALLIELAQGHDDETADAALQFLTSDATTTDEAALVMARGKLRAIRRRAAEMLCQPHQPPDVQEQAARVLLELDYPALVLPVLSRLAQSADTVERQRWAAQELAALGSRAADEMRAVLARTEEPVVGQYLAEGLLAAGRSAQEYREAALWLGTHSNLPRAVEVLGDLALSARVSGSDAVQATNDLAHFAARWAGAGRLLARLVTESPHPSVRTRALDLLLREHPSEMPLALLVDLAVTGSLGPADRLPVMQQLQALAQPAATRLVARIAESDDTDKRARLFQVVNELPDRAVLPALMRLSRDSSSMRLRAIAAQQLISRGQFRVGYATLAAIALHADDPVLRESVLYELGMGLPRTEPLIVSVMERTRDEQLYLLARDLLRTQQRSLLDRIADRWDRWVATLPLGWVDRLVRRR